MGQCSIHADLSLKLLVVIFVYFPIIFLIDSVSASDNVNTGRPNLDMNDNLREVVWWFHHGLVVIFVYFPTYFLIDFLFKMLFSNNVNNDSSFPSINGNPPEGLWWFNRGLMDMICVHLLHEYDAEVVTKASYRSFAFRMGFAFAKSVGFRRDALDGFMLFHGATQHCVDEGHVGIVDGNLVVTEQGRQFVTAFGNQWGIEFGSNEQHNRAFMRNLVFIKLRSCTE